MKRFSSTLISVVPTLMLATVVLLSAAPANAQRGTGPTNGRPSPDGTLKTMDETHAPSIRERQFKVVEMEREAARRRTPAQEQLALAQIAEDYEKIQLINNKMMSATMGAAPPNYQHIANTTAEIKTRANRMKDNLRLAQADDDEKRARYKKPEDAAEMKAGLLLLDGSIMSFVKNPIFKDPGVVNVQQAAKASADLEAIIELSQRITKDAQRLSKTAAKTP